MPAQLTCEQVSNCFIKSPPVINREICDRSPEYRRHWFDMVPQSNYAWGEGFEKTKYTFRGGHVPQDLKWVPVEEERDAGTNGANDPGHDPCDYDAHLVTYGLDAVNYGAFRTHTRTNKFCLDSMLHKFELQQQFRLMVEAFTRTTMGVFEKAHKLFYLLFSDIYVATGDPTTFINSRFQPTQLGELPNIAGLNVTSLSMDHLRWLYRHMMTDISRFALGFTDGAPDFGLSTSPETIDQLYDQSPEAFDVLKRQPDNELLSGFGFTYTREHFMMMADTDVTRLDETVPGSGVLQEVHREELQNAICGTLPFASEAWAWEAPFELSIIVLKPGSVVTANIPVPMTNFPGGADFSTRNYVGDFQFIRPPADCGNEKRNVGWWFNEYFVEPEPGCARGIAILHRRCLPTAFDLGNCEPCPTDPCPAPLPAKAGVVDVPGNDLRLDIDLTGAPGLPALPLPIGYVLSFELQNGDIETGTVTDNSGDPVHEFEFNVETSAFETTGSNPIVSCVDPALPACGVVCDCDDNVGDPEDIQVQFVDFVINLGVGGVINVDFGDASSVNATIKSIGNDPQVGPTYVLTFPAPRLCADNGGIVQVGTCP